MHLVLKPVANNQRVITIWVINIIFMRIVFSYQTLFHDFTAVISSSFNIRDTFKVRFIRFSSGYLTFVQVLVVSISLLLASSYTTNINIECSKCVRDFYGQSE